MQNIVHTEDTTANAQDADVITPDGAIVMPAYVPTIEETIKASGAHRSFEVA